MASENQTAGTPSKSYISVACTPTTKKQVCVVCGKREESCKHRVQLFKNDKKTESCKLVEKYLEIQIIPDQTVNSVCQNCQRSLNTIQSRIQVHKLNYEKTVSQLKKSHGRLSKKRLPFDDLAVTTPKRTPPVSHDFVSPDFVQVSTLLLLLRQTQNYVCVKCQLKSSECIL